MNPLTYQARRVRALPPLNVAGRMLKLYAVFSEQHAHTALPSEAALHRLLEVVLPPLVDERDHPAGFAILHFANDGIYLLVSRWYDANMLKHQVYQCRIEGGHIQLSADLAETQIIACVWELEILKFERDAWVRTVLAQGRLDPQTLDNYLTAQFSGWV